MTVAFLSTFDVNIFSSEFKELLSIGMNYVPVGTAEEVIGLCATGQVEGVVLGHVETYSYHLIRTLKSDPHTNVPILVLLGPEQLEQEDRLLLTGADDVVCAPWNPRGIRARIERMCSKHLQSLGIEANYGVMKLLTQTVEKHDPYTAYHVERLRYLSGHVAIGMGLISRDVAAVRAAGLLHDIGKIAIPSSILRKPSTLTPDEWALMRLHPVHGEEIARGLQQGDEIAPMVRSHHERWDGSGYPDGLGDTDIPLGGRIVAAVDAFDAMTSHRPYRAALSIEEAKGRLIRAAGTQFDPNVVEALLNLNPQMFHKQFAFTLG